MVIFLTFLSVPNNSITNNSITNNPTTDNRSLECISLLLALFCLTASSGFLTGRLITNHESPITFQSDTRPLIPTIHIEGIRNGLLHGSIKGSARVIVGSQTFTESGIFALEASSLRFNEIVVIVPDNAQFVASSRGKKYYPVFSSGGERIVPKNRVYFETEREAEAEGYVQ